MWSDGKQLCYLVTAKCSSTCSSCCSDFIGTEASGKASMKLKPSVFNPKKLCNQNCNEQVIGARR